MSAPGIVPPHAVCKHGREHFCGFCLADALPKCKHGNHSFCGFCLQEKGDGEVRGPRKPE